MFFGRESELKELDKRFNSGRFEMGVIYGARRIGKTSLIQKFISNKESIYFQAKESSEFDNRSFFSKLVNDYLKISYSFSYPTYTEAFDAILNYVGDKPIVIVIDEISYLAQSDKGFLSELQFNIDHKFKNSQVKLILSGSTISFMQDILKDKRGPLFQRSTFQMNIKKMNFSAALLFLDGISNEEKIQYLSIFGEHPYYLEMIDKSHDFNYNLKSLLFSRYGTLVDAPDKVLPSSSKDQNTYNAILKAIANRKRTNKEIALDVKKEPNYVATYLSKLVDNEIIEKRESFNRNQKMNYYEISDNLIRFWYRFIFDSKEVILQNMGENIYLYSIKAIHEFISKGFEDVVLSYLSEKNQNGELGYYYDVIRGYKVDNSELNRSIELDGLAKGIGDAENRLLVVECKYQNKSLSLAVLEHLKESISTFSAEYYDIYLFSKSGFSNDILLLNDSSIHLLTIEDMFK